MYRHPLLERISVYVRPLHGVPDPQATRRVRWTPLAVAMASILMALDGCATLGDRCREGLACLDTDFTRRRRVGRTYNGLQRAVERQAGTVPSLLKASLRAHVHAALQTIRRKDRWIILAADGSKEELPRTRSNEEEFGIGDNGAVPHAFETVIVDVYTGLLWDWRIGAARDSEKKHLEEMIDALPHGTLLLADSNFGGYPIWSALQEKGHHFLIRVGGNAALLTGLFPDEQIERQGDIVYAWPKARRATDPPLRLRLIRVGPRSNPVYLVTNVLDQAALSKRDAANIYRKRWGVELFYRTFKRTMGYAKLSSRAGRRARMELEWGLIAASVAILIGIRSLHHSRKDPRRLSAAALLRALRASLRCGAVGTRARALARGLRRAVQAALRDRCRRDSTKKSRHTRITKNTPKPLILKPPRVRPATATERHAAKTYPKPPA
jgi:hypothetical protein